MKIEISKLGSIFTEALDEKLEERLKDESYYDSDGRCVISLYDTLKVVRDVLGIEEE